MDHVERELRGGLEALMREETWRPLSADLPVLASSNRLVEALRREMRDCVARVSRGPALLALAAAFQRVYRAYASRLVARLPRTAAGGTGGAAVLGTAEWQVRLGEEDAGLICLVATTAEHCQEMVRQLARAVAAKLEPPLGGRVDMSEEEGEFQAVIAQCLSVLLLGIETKLEPALAALQRTNWAAMEMVRCALLKLRPPLGWAAPLLCPSSLSPSLPPRLSPNAAQAGDQSGYVGTFRRVLAEAGAALAPPSLPPNTLRFFLDKLLRSVGPRRAEAVLRCRKISDVGCQQLRLDVEGVKGALLEMAREGGRGCGAGAGWGAGGVGWGGGGDAGASRCLCERV